MAVDSKNLLQRGLNNLQGPFSTFISAQTTSSWFLLLATIVALWWANTDYVGYQNLTHTSIEISMGDIQLHTSLKHIINDGLMVIFFFLIGLEIKREILAGDLARPKHRRMLIICALGGMVCPAFFYLLFNWSLDSQIGWGIPMATDTAFALGVIAIVRKQVSTGLLAFLVGLAIMDDVGAILVIAIFYTQNVSILYLVSACVLIAFLALGNYAGVRQQYFYIIAGVAVWWTMLKSGIHPTFAGVAIAMTVPARPKLTSEKLLVKAKTIINSIESKSDPMDVLASRNDHDKVLKVRNFAEQAVTPLRRWEDMLVLPVSLFILPVFVLTNAGVHISFSSFMRSLQDPIGLGIIIGLVLGKFIGISGTCWLALRYNIGCLPDGVNFKHIIGVSLIAGIGFTMSTFIATLGFESQPDHLQVAKSAILIGSLVSAIIGVLFIRFVAAKK